MIAALGAADPVQREAAVARLRLAGRRGVPRVLMLLQSNAPPAARAAALAALEGIDDPRVVEPAVSAMRAAEPDVAIAAVAVLRAWLPRDEGTRALDALAAAALDGERDGRVRTAALDALSDLPRHLVQPILEQAPPADASVPTDDAARLREWLAAQGSTAPLSVLHELVVRARERERSAATPHARLEWQGARAAVHAMLAGRGSRVALYDLRETFDGARAPLPHDFLAAVTAIGDATCLEPMARAWSAAEGEAWWRDRLAEAATGILHRTGVSGRSAVVKRIRAKWEGFL